MLTISQLDPYNLYQLPLCMFISNESIPLDCPDISHYQYVNSLDRSVTPRLTEAALLSGRLFFFVALAELTL